MPVARGNSMFATYLRLWVLYSLENHHLQNVAQVMTGTKLVLDEVEGLASITFPTAASPKRTSFTLDDGLGAFDSAMVQEDI